ncbi:MAG: 4-hydroxythreonine-4-phosphate dehydrogenase PdxA, partial [Elusimicrobiales bacterium]
YTSDEKKYAGLSSFRSFEVAVKLIKNRCASAVVTSPISKEAWLYSGTGFNGHTDYFRKVFKKDVLMSFKKGKIISAVVCEHIPLKEVSRYVKKKNLINKITLLHSLLLRLGIKKPSIAVSGLNPHCGENGNISTEEISEIIPAVKYFKLKSKKVSGPFNPDDCLRMNIEGRVDASLFMYHDQLIPLLKVLSLNKNDIVHITWGLGFVRTSPTHGTAYDIAWKNKADCTSMLEAIKTAFSLLL